MNTSSVPCLNSNEKELMNIWEDGIRGEGATDVAKDVNSAISIRVMQSVE